jgi:hypothetical protein
VTCISRTRVASGDSASSWPSSRSVTRTFRPSGGRLREPTPRWLAVRPVRRHLTDMPVCGQTGVLIITMTFDGTTTNVARRRIDLHCNLEANHTGPHRDTEQGEEWESGKAVLLRHEDEAR